MVKRKTKDQKRIEILEQALKDIVDPISMFKRKMKPDEILNVFMALKMSDSAQFLKEIAKEALEK